MLCFVSDCQNHLTQSSQFDTDLQGQGGPSRDTEMTELQPIGHNLVIVTFVFGSVAFATLFVRLWFRARQRKYDTSDTLLIAAMVRLDFS
jgi:hypothetical protein